MLGIALLRLPDQEPGVQGRARAQGAVDGDRPRHPVAEGHGRRPVAGLRPDRQGHGRRGHDRVRLGQVAHGQEGRGSQEAAGRSRREARHQVHLLVQHQRVPQEDGDLRAVGVEDQARHQHRARGDGVQGAAQEAP